jgi:hypothetical protein
LLIQLYEAWEHLPPEKRQPFLIPEHGMHVLTITHPALPERKLSAAWTRLYPLKELGFVDFEFKRSGGHLPVGTLWLTAKGRDYVLELRRVEVVRSQSGKPRLFIVHGHDDRTKLEVKNFLQNRLRLPEPIILHELPSGGRTIIEKFEDAALKVDGAIVLLTPDDEYVMDGSIQELRRARQNVILELGFFMALLGRRSGKVLLLHKGSIELPSDLGGVVYIDISSGIESKGEEIRRELDLA